MRCQGARVRPLLARKADRQMADCLRTREQPDRPIPRCSPGQALLGSMPEWCTALVGHDEVHCGTGLFQGAGKPIAPGALRIGSDGGIGAPHDEHVPALQRLATHHRPQRLGIELAAGGIRRIDAGRIDTLTERGYAGFEPSPAVQDDALSSVEFGVDIVHEGHAVGRVTLAASLGEVRERVLNDIEFVVVMTTIAIAAALLLATRLLRGRKVGLLSRVWRINPSGVETRTIDMHIARLREKMRDDPEDPRVLVTVRGKWYKFAVEAAETTPVPAKK